MERKKRGSEKVDSKEFVGPLSLPVSYLFFIRLRKFLVLFSNRQY